MGTNWSSGDQHESKQERREREQREARESLIEGLAVLAQDWNGHDRPSR